MALKQGGKYVTTDQPCNEYICTVSSNVYMISGIRVYNNCFVTEQRCEQDYTSMPKP